MTVDLASEDISIETHASTAEHRINPELELRFELYAVCGCIVVLASAINIIVFSSSKEFRQKYILFNALAVADMINGISFVAAGVGRKISMQEGRYFVAIRATDCLYNTPWAILMIVAGQLPAFLNFFLSMERVIALNCASWYRIVWKEHHKNYLVLMSFGLTAALLLLVFLLDKTHETISSSRICAVMNSTGIVFGTVHYSLIAVTYLFCFVALLFIFMKTNKKKIPTKDERRRQRMLQTLTGVSVVLVSIPNLVLILNEWKIPKINDLVVGIAYCLYALHSALSFPIYMYFRPDFNRRFWKLFLCRKEERKQSELTIATSKAAPSTKANQTNRSTVAVIN